jgi:hypothetical protein
MTLTKNRQDLYGQQPELVGRVTILFIGGMSRSYPKMENTENTLAKAAQVATGELLSLLLGIVGGGLSGAAILVFGALVGRSGTTGTEYFGYWDISLFWLGLLYGGFFGAPVGLVAYPLAVHKIGFQRSVFPAFVGTLAGGFAGALAAPPLAVVTGIGGCFIALIVAKRKHAKPKSRSAARRSGQ